MAGTGADGLYRGRQGTAGVNREAVVGNARVLGGGGVRRRDYDLDYDLDYECPVALPNCLQNVSRFDRRDCRKPQQHRHKKVVPQNPQGNLAEPEPIQREAQ